MDECGSPNSRRKQYFSKKIRLVSKILCHLQTLLQTVEKTSNKNEENWKAIEILQNQINEIKASLKKKEAKLASNIEKIWSGIEETTICLKTMEECIESNKENVDEHPLQFPSYDGLDDIVDEFQKNKSRKWKKLKSKLQDLDETCEDYKKYKEFKEEEEAINQERPWQVFDFNFESEDESTSTTREQDPFSDVPVFRKRKKIRRESSTSVTTTSTVNDTLPDSSILGIPTEIDTRHEDDENFAQYLEDEATRFQKKPHLKMRLKKSKTTMVNSQEPPAKCSNSTPEESTCMNLPPVLQELSLNNTEEVSSRPMEITPHVILEESSEVSKPTVANQREYTGPIYETFEDMNLTESLISGINLWGITEPTTLQKMGIPAILLKNDMVIEGPPYQGKTTLAAIAILNQIKPSIRQPQALFLLNSTDLADIAHRTIQDLGTLMDISSSCCKTPDLVEFSQIFLSTPATAYDFILSRKFSVDLINILVIDEILPENQSLIMKVLYNLMGNTQVIILCRTLTQEISSLSLKLRNPLYFSNQDDCMITNMLDINSLIDLPGIGVENEIPINNNNNNTKQSLALSLDIDFSNMNQFYVIVETDDLKIRVINALSSTMEQEQAIIFCNSNAKADWLARKMRENEKGLEVCSVTSGRQRETIEHLLTLFDAGISRVLISTDFITRSSYKVKQVPLVLNYEFPNFAENYTQRILCAGRTKKSSTIDEAYKNPVLVFNFLQAENLPILQGLAEKFSFSVTPMSTQNS